MKIHMSRGNGFYVRYLLIFACFLGSLVIGPAALAQRQGVQQPKVVVTIVSDTKYGGGGTKETRLDDKLRLDEECWRDVQGRARETHYFVYDDKGALDREGWVFNTAFSERVTLETTFFRLTRSGDGNSTMREDSW